MAHLNATVARSGRGLLEQAWPPVGLAFGLLATAAWIGFLAINLMNLLGLAL